jgi:thiamine pyrophosphokinase
MKACLILANGDPPKKSVITFLIKSGYETLICADGGANSAKKLGLLPKYIIGDFDSINNDVLKYYSSKSVITRVKRQNDTDVEKAIKLAIKKKYSSAILLGATGDRLDHSFCNIGIILKYFDRIKISILHAKSFISVYSGSVLLNTKRDETISIYGVDEKTKVTSYGLKYNLKNSSLPFGKKESTSNVAIGKEVKLEIKNGKMLIVRDYETLRKNGFFRNS